MTIPNLPQRTDPIHAATTMKFVLDNENIYHSRMNSILQNEATLFPQRSAIDNVVVTNQCNQSIEGCVHQQARERLTSVTVERNGSVEPNGKQLEHGSIENLDETGRHETIETTAF